MTKMLRTKLILILTITNLIITKCDDETTNLEEESEILRNAERPEDVEIARSKEEDNILEYNNTERDINSRIDYSNEHVDTNTTGEEFGTTEATELPPEAQHLKHDGRSSEEEYMENVTRSRDDEESDSAEVTETEPPQETTKADYDVDTSLKAPASEEDQEIQGQRNPKTENSEPNAAINRRNHDNQSRPVTPLSKSSTLKGWLEDSLLRPPSGLLVPLRPAALSRALAVWNDLAVQGLNVSDIVIVGYDSNGINWRSRHNLKPVASGKDRDVSEALSKLLLKYQGFHTDSASDGTMRALASAAKLVPYDSALFVITDKGAGDPQRLPLALRTLVEKRLKVYTIWTDPNHPSIESELALEGLKNISQHTDGEVLPYSMQIMDVDSSSNSASDSDVQRWNTFNGKPPRKGKMNSELDYNRFDTLLVRRGGGEAISLGLPVENGVSALKVYIEGAVEHAVLYPPNEAPQIDLYNTTSVAAFSPSSKTDGLNPRDVYLVFPGAEFDMDMLSVVPANPRRNEGQPSMVGVWHLSVRCDTCDYRLYVRARSRIHFDIDHEGDDMLKFRIIGPVAIVRESLLVDEYGAELAKLPFMYQLVAGDEKVDQIDPSTELVAKVPMPTVKGSKIYAKIVGRDSRGEPFVRLSGPLPQPEVRMGRSTSVVFPDNDLEKAEAYSASLVQARNNDTNVLPYNRVVSQIVNHRGSLLTAVQIGLSTRLYGAPGDNLQLHFEVTNYREQSVRFTFEAVGELRFLTGINPARQVIAPGQTTNVIVSLTISSSAQPGARDLITFTAYGLEQVSISAYVYVINSGEVTSDVWAPEVSHNFQGTCIGRMGDDCAQHVWSATIIARDALGGLLRLTSSPIGLIYDSNFISGTREQVTATYRATCCAPRMLVNAVDSFGNTNSYVVDISNYFTAASIAAIVLGVILAIALILLLIFLIYWCVKRRRESRELPYTTSSRNMS